MHGASLCTSGPAAVAALGSIRPGGISASPSRAIKYININRSTSPDSSPNPTRVAAECCTNHPPHKTPDFVRAAFRCGGGGAIYPPLSHRSPDTHCAAPPRRRACRAVPVLSHRATGGIAQLTCGHSPAPERQGSSTIVARYEHVLPERRVSINHVGPGLARRS
eukprot:3242895-Prymnesium_polylepis.1